MLRERWVSGMAHEEHRAEDSGDATGVTRSAPGSVGAWSRSGELLGGARLPRGTGGGLEGYAYCSVSRGTGERGIRFTLHGFDGGYRVLVENWGDGEDRTIWLAPADEEEESYIGLFSEEDVRERFPYLLAALELPDGIEVRGGGAS